MDTPTMIHQLRLQLWNLIYSQWKEHLFSEQWWFIVVVMAISYVLWWKYVEKSRLLEILLFGCFIAVVRTIIEDIGVTMGLWSFNVRLFPLGVSLFLNDLTVVPLTFMLVYQYSASWKSFLIWSLIAEGLIAFAFHPLLSMLSIYKEWTWSNVYSFFIMIVMAALLRAILLGILQIVHTYRAEPVNTLSTTFTPKLAMKLLNEDDHKED